MDSLVSERRCMTFYSRHAVRSSISGSCLRLLRSIGTLGIGVGDPSTEGTRELRAFCRNATGDTIRSSSDAQYVVRVKAYIDVYINIRMGDSVSQEAQALVAAHRARTDAHVYARTHAYRRYMHDADMRGHYMNV